MWSQKFLSGFKCKSDNATVRTFKTAEKKDKVDNPIKMLLYIWGGNSVVCGEGEEMEEEGRVR